MKSPDDLKGWNMDQIMKANAYLDMRADYKMAYSALAKKPKETDSE